MSEVPLQSYETSISRVDAACWSHANIPGAKFPCRCTRSSQTLQLIPILARRKHPRRGRVQGFGRWMVVIDDRVVDTGPNQDGCAGEDELESNSSSSSSSGSLTQAHLQSHVSVQAHLKLIFQDSRNVQRLVPLSRPAANATLYTQR